MSGLRRLLLTIRRDPGTSVIAVLSITIGIVLNSMVFSVVDWVWLQPSPFSDWRRVVHLFASSDREPEGAFSYPDFRDIREQLRSLSDLVAIQHRGAILRGDELSESLLADVVSRNYFTLLGVRAASGDVFTDEDPEVLKAEPVVVISHGLWQRRFGGDPDIIGQSIVLTDRNLNVIGVTPPGFTGTRRMVPTDLWYPVETWGQPQERSSREARTFELMGRLQAGASIREAQSEAEVVFRRLDLRHPATGEEERALVLSEPRFLTRTYGGQSILLLGIAGIVLIIACANVSGMLTAKALARNREMAIRIALGSSRKQLIGLLPALQASRPDLVPVLKGERSFPLGSQSRLGSLHILVVAQMALSLILVATTLLLTRSYLRCQTADLGFRKRDVLVAYLRSPRGEVPARLFFNELIERIRGLPGVEGVSLARHVPFYPSGGGASRRLYRPERAAAGDEEGQAVLFNIVEPDYFDFMGIRVVRGRTFTDLDGGGSPRVVVINQTMAERIWTGQDPIGRMVSIGDPSADAAQVIGIVADGYYNSLTESRQPYFYVPYAQMFWGEFLLLVATDGDPAGLVQPVRREIRTLSGSIDLFPMTTLKETIRFSLYMRELTIWLLGVFALIGLLLAGVGLYGVVAYSVHRRTFEIGVRTALGAQQGDVLRMVARSSARLGALGLMIGLPLALAVAGMLRGFLFEVSPIDPLSILLSLGLLIAITLLAGYLPARRALEVDPLAAIRRE